MNNKKINVKITDIKWDLVDDDAINDYNEWIDELSRLQNEEEPDEDCIAEVKEMIEKYRSAFDYSSLPKEITHKFDYNGDDDELLDNISDWLSDEYGYCHGGFMYKIEDGTK